MKLMENIFTSQIYCRSFTNYQQTTQANQQLFIFLIQLINIILFDKFKFQMFDNIVLFKNGQSTPKKHSRQMDSTDWKKQSKPYACMSAHKQSYLTNSNKKYTRLHDELSSDDEEEIHQLSKTIKKLKFQDGNAQKKNVQRYRNNLFINPFQIQEQEQQNNVVQKISIEKQLKYPHRRIIKKESSLERKNEDNFPNFSLYRLNSTVLDNTNIGSQEYLGDNIYIKQILRQFSNNSLPSDDQEDQNETSRFNKDYQVIQIIGKSKTFSGTCYKCLNRLDRIVYFVKQIKIEYEILQLILYPILRQQMQIYNSDTNNHFIKFYQSWNEYDNLYLVYEPATYSIQELNFQRKKLTEKEIRSLLIDISNSLSFLKQKKNSNHLNLRPSNIMNCRGRYKTMDMLFNMNYINLMNEFNAKYMAPQLKQFYLEGSTDFQKCDIYSLGYILMQNMTGKFDHLEVDNKFQDIKMMKKILKSAFLYSPSLKKLIMRMVSINPKRRPSAKDLDGLHDEPIKMVNRKLSL